MSDESRLSDLRRRVESDPMSIAFAALAEEYRKVGRFQEAVAVCRAGLTRHPAYVSARVTLGRALLDLHELDAAETELQHVLKVAPENLAALRAVSDIQQHRREVATAAAVVVSTPAGPNVIPFEADLMPHDITPPAPLSFSPVFERPEPGPVLTSLDRFLDAIVTLKRATV